MKSIFFFRVFVISSECPLRIESFVKIGRGCGVIRGDTHTDTQTVFYYFTAAYEGLCEATGGGSLRSPTFLTARLARPHPTHFTKIGQGGLEL